MAYADDLKKALDSHVQTSKLHYMDGWKREWYRPNWASNKGRPAALILHHTAGAATSSTNPDHAGNQHGANDGQIKYVNRHPSYNMPASAFTLDRDGCIYVNAALPCYHAGEGSFRGTEWASLNVPDDSANSYCLGVECVDKGQEKTFTDAMKESLRWLAEACAEASGWKDTSTLYLPRHKDWAPNRKVDIKYSNADVQEWMTMDTLWDGKKPDIEGVFNAQNDSTLANPACFRLACRLHDLGFFAGTPVDGSQKYPSKAVANFTDAQGWRVYPAGAYSPAAHDAIFGA